MNDGIKMLFRALEVNKTLGVLNIADNQFGEEKDLVNQMCKVFETTDGLNIDVRYNGLYDYGTPFFLCSFL